MNFPNPVPEKKLAIRVKEFLLFNWQRRLVFAFFGFLIGQAFERLYGVYKNNLPTSSSEWASWVQAWGSILAIFAAVVVAWWQQSTQRARETKAMNDSSDMLRLKACHFIRLLNFVVQEIKNELDPKGNFPAHKLRFYCKMLDEARTPLMQLPVWNNEDINLTLCVEIVRRTSGTIANALSDPQASPHGAIASFEKGIREFLPILGDHKPI